MVNIFGLCDLLLGNIMDCATIFDLSWYDSLYSLCSFNTFCKNSAPKRIMIEHS